MSDDLNQPSPSAPEPTQPAQAQSIRLFVLLGVLVLAVAGLAYDRFVARPGVQEAYDKVYALLDDSFSNFSAVDLNLEPNTDPGESGEAPGAPEEDDGKKKKTGAGAMSADVPEELLTGKAPATLRASGDASYSPDEISELLGRKPSEVEEVENGIVEVYKWRRGLPILSYDLFVIYQGKANPLLYGVLQNQRPEEGQLPPNYKATQLPDNVEPLPGDGPPGGPGGGGPPGGAGRGGPGRGGAGDGGTPGRPGEPTGGDKGNDDQKTSDDDASKDGGADAGNENTKNDDQGKKDDANDNS